MKNYFTDKEMNDEEYELWFKEKFPDKHPMEVGYGDIVFMQCLDQQRREKIEQSLKITHPKRNLSKDNP